MELKRLEHPMPVVVGVVVLCVDTISQKGFIIDPKDVIAVIVDKNIWVFNNS